MNLKLFKCGLAVDSVCLLFLLPQMSLESVIPTVKTGLMLC